MIQSKTANKPASIWIQLRSNGHLQGRLEIDTLRLEIVKGGRLTIYDLRESSRQGQAVIVESKQIDKK
jgi:hypothetical protein